MDGVLVVDKPAGPSSHDVVARIRRALGERRVGHTGTLDPAATGVLPLVVGRATRLARFLSAGDKSYDAVVRLGQRTDTADALGEPIGPRHDGPMPARAAIDAALDAFRGTFSQQPPAFSAKKIGGVRSYAIARAGRRRTERAADAPAPSLVASAGEKKVADAVTVTTRAIQILSIDGDTVALRVDCSAGFYVRSLAHDLGERLGTGAHLASLRRTRSGDFTAADAVPLDEAERDPSAAARRVVPLPQLLPRVSAVVLTAVGAGRAIHGHELGPADAATPFPHLDRSGAEPIVRAEPIFRLFDPTGALVAIAEPSKAPGLLHPFVVLV
jgi:tRNA pseudouridine55 synthase